ncbi:E3 ubiquitin-protein ligase arih1l-like isoform X2 [Tripterygium wilfordii]|nr:E3 ubiquitin-protein ligase arih1l-like isoform X2 [Tripterygium wilfordii]
MAINSAENQRENPGKHPRETEIEEDISSFFTCEICIEPVAMSKKFKNKKDCTHPFCQGCIAKYIEMKLQENTTSGGNIYCPGLNCSCILDPRSHAGLQSHLVCWCDFLCDSAVLSSERSYCPNRNCLELVVNECLWRQSVRNSFASGARLHGMDKILRCKESRDGDDHDILFAKLMKRMKWRRCHHCVERNHGCPHIVCRCGTLFCYLCGRRLSISHRCWQSHFFDTDMLMDGGFLICMIVATASALLCVICTSSNDTCLPTILGCVHS